MKSYIQAFKWGWWGLLNENESFAANGVPAAAARWGERGEFLDDGLPVEGRAGSLVAAGPRPAQHTRARGRGS